eukprot:3772041-Alexandrium_andersonii.AAC.1
MQPRRRRDAEATAPGKAMLPRRPPGRSRRSCKTDRQICVGKSNVGAAGGGPRRRVRDRLAPDAHVG